MKRTSLALLLAMIASMAWISAAAGQLALSGVQLRVIEFGDHPDPNTGAPKVLESAQAWPVEFTPLSAAVSAAVGRDVTVYDMRRGAASTNASEELEETTVKVLSVTPSGAKVEIRMDAARDPVEATVPMNGTVVIGSEHEDEHHAFVAVSLFDGVTASRIPEIFTTRDPSVTAPAKRTGAPVQSTQAAIEHHLKGVAVYAEIDESGNVVAAHALGRYASAADQAAIDHIIRTWKFQPAMRGGKAVRVVTTILVPFG